MNKKTIYSPSRNLAERGRLFDIAQTSLEGFMTQDYFRLIDKFPIFTLFERGIVNALEEYFLYTSTFGRDKHNDALKVFRESLRKEFPIYGELAVTELFNEPNKTTRFTERDGDMQYILFVDFDRNYSASLVKLACLLRQKNITLLRFRFPYFGHAPFRESPLEKIIPNCIYMKDIMCPHNNYIFIEQDNIKYGIKKYLRKSINTTNGHLIMEILNHFLEAKIYRHGKHLESAVKALVSKYNIKLIVTADDSWAESRVFALFGESPIVKFQDGLLVKHYSLRQNFCDLWCVWSRVEYDYLVASGIMPNMLAICRTRNVGSIRSDVTTKRQNKSRPTIVYASRPDSRDVSLHEKKLILRDLCRIAKNCPRITILHKLHPSENMDDYNLPKSPANFTVVRKNVPFGHIIKNADLLLSGVSLTLYEAVIAGVPAARIAYGPRPNIALFSMDIFPIVDSKNTLEMMCLNPTKIKTVFFTRQQNYVQSALSHKNLSITKMLCRYKVEEMW